MHQTAGGWLPRSTARSPLPKRQYRKRARDLRLLLLEAQNQLREADRAVVVVVAGVDGAGKGETVNLMSQWMDPRWIRTRAFDGRTDEERERPPYWRYWRSLPPHGCMTMYLSAWYSEPLLRRVEGAPRDWLDEQLEVVRRFERTVALDGTSVVKLWLHLDRAAQENRLHELSRDPEQSWRVTPTDWENLSRYDAFVEATEEILEETHVRHAPWIVIDGSDPRSRGLDVGEAVLKTLRSQDGAMTTTASGPDVQDEGAVDGDGPARASREVEDLTKATYQKELERLQLELGGLHRIAQARGISLIGVFEGRDAAGKGGAIRRVVPALDARRVDVVRIGPPSDEERARPYLWRFWQRLPRAGYVALFDRSWYGRVLVERVDELIPEDAWQRAYEEINHFERQIVEHGTVLVKFWLEISADEQERRFEERRRLAYKRWKLTEDDLHNRSHWDDYSAALSQMLARTNEAAPWSVIPANKKRSARLEVLGEIVRSLRCRLDEVD